ncbi:putative DNA-binding domain-containing protein [Undibacterium sp. SXout11W]|uniref:HvfC/BufC family peptide modification chaperone n=1 Tax=Undibacterium sp. SXout11W TaxID=3413050 RepID=UPI003BF107EF
MIKLEQIQHDFAHALIDPDVMDRFAPQLRASARQNERFSYYRGNMTGIWASALTNAYPVLLQLVGTEFFEDMAKAYGRAYPSQSGDLNQFGAQLCDFLKDSEFITDYPYFEDIAKLEWQLHCAYYAADAKVLSLRDALIAAEQCGQDLASASLLTHPAVGLYASPLSAVEIWLAHQEGELTTFPADIHKENFALISRPQWQALVSPLTRADYLALQALFQKANIAYALELALSEDAQFDIGAGLQRWFSDGSFTEIKFI